MVGWATSPDRLRPSLLNADPLVESWSGVYYSTLQLDGINVPVMGATPRAPVAPPLLSGHGLESADQVVLGAGTLHAAAQAGRGHRGGAGPNGAPVKLTIVGTATLPPIGVTGSSHLEMGTGALLSYQLIPPAARNLFEVTPGPNAILVRTKGARARRHCARSRPSGASWTSQSTAARCCLSSGRRRSSTTDRWAPRRCSWARRWRPVPSAPLGITLVTSVRRRRRDLAILKTLGFTGRQLATAVAVQAGVAAVIGCAVGIPAGIALGRVLWDLFAGEISAVPYPTVPVGTIVAIGLLAIALAVLVATIPGRVAARTATSQLLRVE